MRIVFSQDVVLNPVPLIVIDVPEGPRAGEIPVTVPTVHSVNKNCRTLDGTVCKQGPGLINVLEPQDGAGTVARIRQKEIMSEVFSLCP